MAVLEHVSDQAVQVRQQVRMQCGMCFRPSRKPCGVSGNIVVLSSCIRPGSRHRLGEPVLEHDIQVRPIGRRSGHHWPSQQEHRGAPSLSALGHRNVLQVRQYIQVLGHCLLDCATGSQMQVRWPPTREARGRKLPRCRAQCRRSLSIFEGFGCIPGTARPGHHCNKAGPGGPRSKLRGSWRSIVQASAERWWASGLANSDRPARGETSAEGRDLPE
jgi:hypothetical protein